MRCWVRSPHFISMIILFLLLPAQARSQSVDLSDNYNLNYRSFEKYTPNQIGNFNVGGSIGSAIGFDDNVYDLSQNEKSGPFLKSDVYVWLNSNWNKHAFRISAYGSKNHYPGRSGANEYYANVFGYGRFDLPSDIQFEVVTNYQFDEDERGQSVFFNNPATTPADHALDGKVFLTKGFGDFAITIRGGLRYGFHPDVRNIAGNSLNRDDEDYLLHDLRLRGSLNVGEKSNIYIEGGYNRWKFEDTIDRNGFKRGSQGFHVAAGWVFKPLPSLSGEIAVGFRHQSFPDNRFSDLSTFTLDAWATWAVTKRLNLTTTVNTWVKEETKFAQAANLSRSLSIQTDYRVHDRLRLFAIGYYLLEDKLSASIEDHTLQGTFGVNYEVRSGIVATAQFQHKRFYDGGFGGDYKINRIWSGIKFSR